VHRINKAAVASACLFFYLAQRVAIDIPLGTPKANAAPPHTPAVGLNTSTWQERQAVWH